MLRSFLVGVLMLFIMAGLIAQTSTRTDCFLPQCRSFKKDTLVSFHQFKVPASWLNHSTDSLEIRFVHLRSAAKNKGLPVVYLNGGPGATTLSNSAAWQSHYLRKQHDIILLDYRGIGYSSPIECEGFTEALWNLVVADLTPAAFAEAQGQLMQTCAAELSSKDIDLSLYTTPQVVRDLDAVRTALGIPQWLIYSISYGSTLATYYMRDLPEGIAGAILDGPFPMQVIPAWYSDETYGRSLQRLFQYCMEDEACNRAYPNLNSVYSDLILHINQNGITGHDSDGSPYIINIQDWHAMLHQLLYLPIAYPMLPALITELSQQQTHALDALIPQFRQRLNAFVFPIYYTHIKYDANSLSNNSNASNSNLLFFNHPFTQLETWPSPRPDSAHLAFPGTPIPTLILTGELDPVTPPEFGYMLESALTNARHISLSHSGHGVSLPGACGQELVEAFALNPAQLLQINCDKEPTIRFLTNYTSHQKTISFSRDMLMQYKLQFVLPWMYCLVVFVLLLIRALVKAFKPAPPRYDRLLNMSLWLGALAGLGIAVIYMGRIVEGIGYTPFTLLLGVPGSLWLVKLLSAFFLLMGAMSFALILRQAFRAEPAFNSRRYWLALSAFLLFTILLFRYQLI